MIGRTTVILLSTLLLASMAPTTTATGVGGFIDVADGGEAVVSCTGPGFIVCGAVGAFAVGGCVDVPLKGNTCASAGGVVVGGGSSLAIAGGGGYAQTTVAGETLSTAVTCHYNGASGGCAKIRGGLSSGCRSARAGGHGFISNGLGPTAPGGSYLATSPPVTAVSKPCGILLTTASSASPLEVQELLQDALREQLDVKLEQVLSSASLVVPAELQPAFAAQSEAIHAEILAHVEALVVGENFEVSLPTGFEYEILVEGTEQHKSSEAPFQPEMAVSGLVESPFVGTAAESLLLPARTLF